MAIKCAKNPLPHLATRWKQTKHKKQASCLSHPRTQKRHLRGKPDGIRPKGVYCATDLPQFIYFGMERVVLKCVAVSSQCQYAFINPVYPGENSLFSVAWVVGSYRKSIDTQRMNCVCVCVCVLSRDSLECSEVWMNP